MRRDPVDDYELPPEAMLPVSVQLQKPALVLVLIVALVLFVMDVSMMLVR